MLRDKHPFLDNYYSACLFVSIHSYNQNRLGEYVCSQLIMQNSEPSKSTIFAVGQTVRVLCESEETSYRRLGMIACVNLNSVDVLLNNGVEMDDIPFDRVRQLETFELQYTTREGRRGILDFTPLELKEHGNILFGLMDYDRAAEIYMTALDILSPKEKLRGIGAEVVLLTQPQSMHYVTGMIVGEEDGSIEVEYDNCYPFEPSNVIAKEMIVTYIAPEEKRLTATPSPFSNRRLQRSLCMNLSRCCMKRQRPGWAVRWVNIAMALTRSMKNEVDPKAQQELAKFSRDECFIRCKALISANKLDLALKVHSVSRNSYLQSAERTENITLCCSRMLQLWSTSKILMQRH